MDSEEQQRVDQKELARSQDYTEALEICCGKVGLPVSAIRQAGSAVASGDAQEDSDDEVLSLYGKPRRQVVSFEEGPATPRRSAGPTPDIKQAPKEAFEVYAERMWVSFKEHSGVENATRDQEVILQLLKNNAGNYIQQALANGADPPENTFRSLVDWASKIEGRLAKQGKPRAIAATQWVAEGKGGASPQESGTSSRLGCPFCSKPNRGLNHCWMLREALGLPRQSSQSILRDLQAIRSGGQKSGEQSSTAQKSKNASDDNPYSALQAALAALAINHQDML
ncbi:hypothetical protein SKAU_G00169400 [Synaphobranchus kaupii]|uniref:Gag protein n=1 Tax=Synaphobranchus kaupii TaxID=118154 RepID=A0A9Q1FK34_SYNKA|nr:hypothetical protein SKAU_G00169400 [Synaphobranchus kaupii]